jgi:hypothetical protein
MVTNDFVKELFVFVLCKKKQHKEIKFPKREKFTPVFENMNWF